MYWPPRSAGGLPADGFNVNRPELISNVFFRRFLLPLCEFGVNGGGPKGPTVAGKGAGKG
jgi:hypothetical protein